MLGGLRRLMNNNDSGEAPQRPYNDTNDQRHPKAMLGKSFVWYTGLRGTLVAYIRDVGKPGDFFDALMLVFENDDINHKGWFCTSYDSFVAAYSPGRAPVITGSGYEPRIYDNPNKARDTTIVEPGGDGGRLRRTKLPVGFFLPC